MAHSYKWHCKRAGIPVPTKSTDTAPHVTSHRALRMDAMTPHFIRYTRTTFQRVCEQKACPGDVLQRAIVGMLEELERLKS